MTIEQAVEKAASGGWKPDDIEDMSLGGKEYLLAPLFWQSLGKAMGWADSVWGTIGKDGNENGKRNWLVEWHDFIDHLAAGKDINSFFETLS
jgi:hypothetical protein